MDSSPHVTIATSATSAEDRPPLPYVWYDANHAPSDAGWVLRHLPHWATGADEYDDEILRASDPDDPAEALAEAVRLLGLDEDDQ